MAVNKVNKSMHFKISAIAILFCLLISSCVQLSFEDVSSDPKYTALIDKTLKTKIDLWAIGVTADQNYMKVVDYIVLVPGVGFSGPEVITRDRFNKGSTIKIIKVLTTSSIFFSRIIYVVEYIDSDKYKGTEIRVEMTGESDDSNFGLSKLVFKKID